MHINLLLQVKYDLKLKQGKKLYGIIIKKERMNTIVSTPTPTGTPSSYLFMSLASAPGDRRPFSIFSIGPEELLQ